MNKLTPTFADLHKAQANGAGPNPQIMHVAAAHEPTREGGPPPAAPVGTATGAAHNPTPVAVAQPLKVALIGTAPSSRDLAPFNDLSWKIWGCSPGCWASAPRASRVNRRQTTGSRTAA